MMGGILPRTASTLGQAISGYRRIIRSEHRMELCVGGHEVLAEVGEAATRGERRDAAAKRSPAGYECSAGVASSMSTSSSDADRALPRISIDRRLADAGRSAEASVPANFLDRECQRLRLN